jgi:hypothetical protein
VSITPKGRSPKQYKEPIWAWPKSKVPKSSGMQQSSSAERTMVLAMGGKSKVPPSSPGPSSQRTVVRQGRSISKPGDSLEQSSSVKTVKPSVWHGYVISSSLADIKSLGPPTNLVFAKIHQPHDDLTRGRVLNMTARVTFGYSHTPRVAARNALQNVMWGNSGLGITSITSNAAMVELNRWWRGLHVAFHEGPETGVPVKIYDDPRSIRLTSRMTSAKADDFGVS